jgi:hypothetical protein
MQNGFGDGMYWQADPSDDRYSYGSSNGGSYFRYDTRTGDIHDISPRAPLGVRYRFDWTSPMMLSQHDPNVLYVAGNRFFVSKDRGSSWSASDDLSRQIDRDELEIMGVRGRDITISRNDGTGSFGEAVTLDESPIDPAVLWVGFDDGNLKVSRDAGSTWTEVSGNVPGLPNGTYVSRITASFTSPASAWATFDAHRDGDFRPYVFRTNDFGASWTPAHGDLPAMGVVNVLVEHPDNPSTLFVGTEHHVFASTNAGGNWARVPNLPTTHYDDMVIHPREKDLVLGTHGQGIWIVDDTRAIAEWSAASAPVTVFSAARGTINRINGGGGDAVLRVMNDDGDIVREMKVPGSSGTHRVNWDLRHGTTDGESWERWDNPVLARNIGPRGPWVSPGRFTVLVSVNGNQGMNTIEVRGDPEMPISQSMYESREQFMLDALALTEEMSAFARDNGFGGGGGGFGRGPATVPTTPAQKVQAARSMVQRVYNALNGGEVRPGTLYPPTQTQRAQVLEARRLFEEARREVGR